METPEVHEVKELDSRRTDGLMVTLWWVRNTLDTYVTVLDLNRTPPVEHHIDVPKGILPHAVYQHPMAYLPETPNAA